MRKIMTVSAALFGAAILPASNASAHSQEEVHDMLHGQGYDRVEYQSQYRDDEGKPVYRFSACEGRRAINLDVNWYGNIIDRDRAGFCDRGGEYGYRDRDRDGDGDRYRDRD